MHHKVKKEMVKQVSACIANGKNQFFMQYSGFSELDFAFL